MSQTAEFAELCKEARQCCRDGEFQCGLELFEQALQIDEVSETHGHAGTAAFMAGDTEKAVEHFKRAVHLAPANAQHRINLGAVYNKRKEYKNAIDTLRKGLSMDMHCAEGYFNLGMAHRYLKQPQMAIPAFREAIRLNSEMADAHQNLAQVYLEQDNFKEALELAQQAVKLRPKSQIARRILDQVEEARDSARKTVKSLDWIAGVSPTKVDEGFRKLTEEQRNIDRRDLVVLAHSLRKIAGDMKLQIQRELDPSIRQLNRLMVQPERSQVALQDAYATFRQAVKTYNIMRARMGDKMREFREHEESMKEGGASA